MSEINKRIEALEAELQKLKNEVKEPKIENGKWYKDYDYFLVYITDINKGVGYGFGSSGQWYNESNDWGFKDVRPATHQEVKEALIKEAKKRGFKKGVMINHSIEGKGHRALIFNELSYHSGYNWLCDGWGNVVFKDGVWAEIIKDEPIKIGGYEVKKTEFNTYTIGCKSASKTFLNSLRDLMTVNNFKKVSFDGVETDLETINKILAL